jgi:hypothetical protein
MTPHGERFTARIVYKKCTPPYLERSKSHAKKHTRSAGLHAGSQTFTDIDSYTCALLSRERTRTAGTSNEVSPQTLASDGALFEQWISHARQERRRRDMVRHQDLDLLMFGSESATVTQSVKCPH